MGPLIWFFNLNFFYNINTKTNWSCLVCNLMLKYMACTGLVHVLYSKSVKLEKQNVPHWWLHTLNKTFYQYFLLIYQSKYVFNQLQVLYRCDLSVCKSEWINDRTNKNVQNCCTSANLAVMPHILLESDSNQWRETLFSNLIFSKFSGLYNFLSTIW